MTPAETLALTRFVKAACPQQKFDEYTPDAWNELLNDLDFADAKEATKTITRKQPFVSPSEIRAEVRRIRSARIDTVPLPAPVCDPDDTNEYRRQIRETRRAIASGTWQDPHQDAYAAIVCSAPSAEERRVLIAPVPVGVLANKTLAELEARRASI